MAIESQEIKVVENRLRRWAKRLGFRIEKSRARALHLNNRGLYQLIDDRNTVVEGVDYDATLDQIEFALQKGENRLRGA